MKKPILTIAIPTYNRPTKITHQVRLLLPQLFDNVRLVVYDNCSDIPIRSYFTPYELTKFTIIRNKVNIGADANIARCFENCSTNWLWTLSDDDFVKDNSLDIILEEIIGNQEIIFYNFCIGLSFETIGFEQLIKKFKSQTVFSSSFTMSSCLYNMHKLKSSMHVYYSHLSSMMGTIILVLKYIEANENAICKFVNKSPIAKYNSEVGWNYSVFIRRTRFFIESFNVSKKKNLNNRVFLGCHLTNYSLISQDRKESDVSYSERWELFFWAIKNQGLINGFLDCPIVIIKLFFCLIIQSSFFAWLKSKISNL